jgi:biopolymer transport protein TolR
MLHRKRAPMHEINVVPYVDVMLVLLVIFMVTAPLVTPGVVELPSVAKASNAKDSPIELVIREDQSVTMRLRDEKGGVSSERKVGRGEIGKLVRDRQSATPDAPVLIAADKSVRYEAVMNVMDELQRMQVKRVGLLVKPVGASSP